VFNLAIVGVGAWGKNLINSVQNKSDVVRFTRAVTRTPSKVEDFAAQHVIALSDDYRTILEDDTINGVVVSSPAHAHVEQTMAAINAGKHVQVVKPLALTRTDAEALYEAADEKGVFLAVAYERCFLPAADEFRRRVKSGALGKIIHAEGAYCVDRYLAMSPDYWKADVTAAPPGALADHILYMMIELIGPVEELQAHGKHLATDLSAADTSTVTMTLAGGASALLTAIGATANFTRLHFFGTEGWAELRDATHLEIAPRGGDREVIDFPVFDTLREQTESFASAALGKTDYRISRDNAIAGVAAVEAMGISADRNEPIRLTA
jgi:predicted dehydrogenase